MDDPLERRLVELEELIESKARDLGHHLVGIGDLAVLDDEDPLE